ncbi:hypothetical protein O8B93_17995 [Agrobacterium rhizogenes]|uniref:hypothetical protein n=1 Tax=Rhizobium rhizogenes TaxID=359 RepID=UPI0022B61B63|nr:hypothetical protein [Rhizobium rhizogenes]MCZ7449483.1 hypothetical protein [Rhizobium rhizogenes]
MSPNNHSGKFPGKTRLSGRFYWFFSIIGDHFHRFTLEIVLPRTHDDSTLQRNIPDLAKRKSAPLIRSAFVHSRRE